MQTRYNMHCKDANEMPKANTCQPLACLQVGGGGQRCLRLHASLSVRGAAG